MIVTEKEEKTIDLVAQNEALEARILELEAELEKKSDTEMRLLRLQADMDNLRRRVAREKEEWWHMAGADVLTKMLPALDNLERALRSLPEGAAGDWAQGVVMVARQLDDILSHLGLEPVCAEGSFDPQCHEAIMQDSESSEPENTITAVFERGYMYKGRLLRPSKVRVSTGGKGNE